MPPDPGLWHCPTLLGQLVTLEPLVADHAAVLFPLLADEVLWRYTDERSPTTLATLYERYRRLESRRSGDGRELWLNWAVVVPQCGVVGFVQATVSEGKGSAAIAYVIARRFWSRGFGTEAVRELVRFLANTLGVKSITATVDARNAASLYLLRKIGLRIVDASDRRNLQLALPTNDYR